MEYKIKGISKDKRCARTSSGNIRRLLRDEKPR